jgi:hypothetical protein
MFVGVFAAKDQEVITSLFMIQLSAYIVVDMAA